MAPDQNLSYECIVVATELMHALVHVIGCGLVEETIKCNINLEAASLFKHRW
jgi:hypothetical protein